MGALQWAGNIGARFRASQKKREHKSRLERDWLEKSILLVPGQDENMHYRSAGKAAVERALARVNFFLRAYRKLYVLSRLS